MRVRVPSSSPAADCEESSPTGELFFCPGSIRASPRHSPFSEASQLAKSQHRQLYESQRRDHVAAPPPPNSPRRRSSGVEPKNAGGSHSPPSRPRQRAPMAHPVRHGRVTTNATVSANPRRTPRVCRVPRPCGSNSLPEYPSPCQHPHDIAQTPTRPSRLAPVIPVIPAAEGLPGVSPAVRPR